MENLPLGQHSGLPLSTPGNNRIGSADGWVSQDLPFAVLQSRRPEVADKRHWQLLG